MTVALDKKTDLLPSRSNAARQNPRGRRPLRRDPDRRQNHRGQPGPDANHDASRRTAREFKLIAPAELLPHSLPPGPACAGLPR
jgi:hypothetical protein